MKLAIRRKRSQAVWGPRPGTIRRHPEQCEEFLRRRAEARARLGLPPLPDETMALQAINPHMEEWKRHVMNISRQEEIVLSAFGQWVGRDLTIEILMSKRIRSTWTLLDHILVVMIKVGWCHDTSWWVCTRCQ